MTGSIRVTEMASMLGPLECYMVEVRNSKGDLVESVGIDAQAKKDHLILIRSQGGHSINFDLYHSEARARAEVKNETERLVKLYSRKYGTKDIEYITQPAAENLASVVG